MKNTLMMIVMLTLFVSEGCTQNKKTDQNKNESNSATEKVGKMNKTPQKGNGYVVVLETSLGSIEIELNKEKAPITVENFLNYVTTGAYDKTVFHRVKNGFMIQGGDPLGQGTGGPGYNFADEFHSALRHDKAGILSMANSGPNTNGSQFFITLAPTPHLNDRHSVFGGVVEGMDVISAIGNTPTGQNDRPTTDIVIQTIDIERRETP